MAIDIGTATVRERTRRIEIDTPAGDDPILRFYRERVSVMDETVVQRTEVAPLMVRLSDIADRTFSASDIKATGTQLAALIAAAADALAKEAAQCC